MKSVNKMITRKVVMVPILLTLFFISSVLGDCEYNELLRCSMSLPVLSPKNNKAELDKSCLEMKAGINCINNYTNHCMMPAERKNFISMYGAVEKVMEDLCTPGTYQDDYLRHANCIRQIRTEYEMCSTTYNLALNRIKTENTELHQNEEQHRTVCCSLQEYLLCSEQTVQRTCGDEAAVFTSKFLYRMAENIIKTQCLEYRGVECGIPTSSGSRTTLAYILPLLIVALAHLFAPSLAST